MHRRLPLLLVGLLALSLLLPSVAPTPVFAASNSVFGYNTHIAASYPTPTGLAAPAELIASTGAGWVREEFQWSRIEPRPGQLDWNFFDQAVNELTGRGVNILGLLNPAVAWGTPSTADDGDPVGTASFYPPDPQKFAEFAKKVVSRYKDRVKYWQVWNEPDNAIFWRPAPDPVGYANLLKAVYPAIKAADPNAVVISAGLVSPEPAGSFLQILADNGAWGSFDAIGLHPYTDPNGPEAGSIGSVGIGAIQTLAARLGPKPIWVTEYGWSTTPSDRTGNVTFDPETQANYLVRGSALIRAAGVERIMMFRFKDMQLNGGQVFNGYGLLEYGSGTGDYSRRKPSFAAMSTLNQQVGSLPVEGVRTLGDQRVAMDFESFGAWNIFPRENGSIAQSGAQRRNGNAAAEIRYNFGTGGNDYVAFSPRDTFSMPAGTRQMGIWVYGDGSSFDLKVQLRDAENELLQFRIGKLGPPGWQFLTTALTGEVEQGNRLSPGNGRLDGDIRIAAIVLDDDPDSRTGSGTIYIDDITGISGPEAYAVRFKLDANRVVDLVWAVDGGGVNIPTGSGQVTVIDRDGASSQVSSANGVVRIDAQPRPKYVIHAPSSGGGQQPPPSQPPTQPPPSGGVVPPDGNFAAPEIRNVWARTDQPVASGAPGLKARSWIWGPAPITGTMREPYAEASGGSRAVQYFDKSRMEINNPNAPRDQWYVTNGLLVIEMLTGKLQVGNSAYQDRSPAQEAVAGDPAEINPSAPTYATLRSVAFPVVTDKAPNRQGEKVVALLNRDGTVSNRAELGNYNVVIGAYSNELGHNIPQVFLDYFAQKGVVFEGGRYVNDRQIIDALFVLGLPISEPYWAKVKVGGVERDVLMQAFERRVLTYTPDNAPEWRVEMGNVGQHYLRWRYGK